MALQITEAQRTRVGILVGVWLDNTKVLGDGITPDPQYVREWTWPGDMPIAQIKAETKLLALDALAQISTTPVDVPALKGSIL